MILSDREMVAAIRDRAIFILPPPAEENFTSTAVDLTLDKRLLIWEIQQSTTGMRDRLRPYGPNFSVKGLMDDSRWARKIEITRDGFEFGGDLRFLLGYTQQKISLPNASRIAARVEG